MSTELRVVTTTCMGTDRFGAEIPECNCWMVAAYDILRQQQAA
jgi:hypothetical protein